MRKKEEAESVFAGAGEQIGEAKLCKIEDHIHSLEEKRQRLVNVSTGNYTMGT